MGVADTGLGVTWGTGQTFYDSVMNGLYKPMIADVIINPNTLLSRLQRRGDRIRGKSIIFPVHYGRNEGVGAMAFDGMMPEPRAQAYKQYNYFVAHMYGRVKVDGLSADASEGQVASWLEATESEMVGLGRDFARYRQRAYHMNGSGTRCYLAGQVVTYTNNTTGTIGGGGANGTISFPTDYPESGAAVGLADQPRAMWVSIGELIGVQRISDGVILGAGIVTSISDNTSTAASFDILVTSATFATAGVNYRIIRMTTDDSGQLLAKNSNFLNDPMGIGGILDDSDPPTGDLQGIDSDASANSWHRANIVYQNGTSGSALATLTIKKMDEAFGRCVEIGDALPSIILGNFPVIREYAALVMTNRRYVNTDNFDGGYGGLEYNGVPVIADRDFIHNRLAYIVESDLGIEVMVEPQWFQRDGLLWRLANNDTDSIWAAFYCRENLSTMTRNVHTLHTQIDES